MALTEKKRLWLARFRTFYAELKQVHPLATRAWLKHHARVKADMSF